MALIAATALLWGYLIGTWLADTPQPAPPSPSGGAPTPDPDRTAAALGASRDAERSVPPRDLTRQTPPDDNRDRPDGASRSPEPVPSEGKQKVSSGGVPPVLACIRQAESGGNYQAFNGVSHYGAYQLSSRYSPEWARRYGAPEFAGLTADRWPRWAQDKVAAGLFAQWPGAWQTYAGCSA